jgi:hypothetical protein
MGCNIARSKKNVDVEGNIEKYSKLMESLEDILENI